MLKYNLGETIVMRQINPVLPIPLIYTNCPSNCFDANSLTFFS